MQQRSVIHFCAKRSQLLFLLCVHLWWAACLLTLGYPGTTHGGTAWMVGQYGVTGAAGIYGIAGLCAINAIRLAWLRPEGPWSLMAWYAPQQVVVTMTMLGSLWRLTQPHDSVRLWYALGYAIPACLLHTIALIDLARERRLLSHARPNSPYYDG